MAEVVVDASAVLSLLRSEPGAESVAGLIHRALLSVVNEAEVIAVLLRRGHAVDRALEIVSEMPYRVVDLDQRLAWRAATLSGLAAGRRNLSLGDRCCLALAEREGLPALTADKAWAELDLGIAVRLIR